MAQWGGLRGISPREISVASKRLHNSRGREIVFHYGDKNWIGGMGRNAQTGQGNDETRQRRIRRALFVLVSI